MAKLNKVEVTIGGVMLTLTGTESEEYIKRLAAYIDEKMLELQKSKSQAAINSYLRSLLISLNVADDLFKEKDESKKLTQDLSSAKSELGRYVNELGKLTQENVFLTEKVNKLQQELNQAKADIADYKELLDMK